MIDPNEFDEYADLNNTEVDEGFKCPRCPETRQSRSRLAAHIYRVHRRSDRDNSSYDDAVNAAPVSAGMDVAKQDIASMGRALTDIADRMQRLDDAATSPDAVRRATLREVHDRLIDAGDYSAAMLVNKMLKDGA